MYAQPISLMGQVQPWIGVLARQSLERLDQEDFSQIIRITHLKFNEAGKKTRLTDEEAVVSLKQYYALPLLFPERKELAVSSIVDDYWHNHVLDTKGYRRFCDSVYGRFMDHVLLDKTDHDALQHVTALYGDTREMLQKAFGQHVLEKAYPLKATADVVICTYDYE